MKLANRSAPLQVARGPRAIVYVLDITRPAAAAVLEVAAPHLPSTRLTARRPGLWPSRAAARALAAVAAERHLQAAGVTLWHEASGRPRLRAADGSEPAFLSISHSRGRVAVGLAPTPIGIDIEQADAARLSRGGSALLDFLAARIDHAVAVTATNFHAVWTAHEAAIKLDATLAALIADGAWLGTVQLAGGYVLTVGLPR